MKTKSILFAVMMSLGTVAGCDYQSPRALRLDYQNELRISRELAWRADLRAEQEIRDEAVREYKDSITDAWGNIEGTPSHRWQGPPPRGGKE